MLRFRIQLETAAPTAQRSATIEWLGFESILWPLCGPIPKEYGMSGSWSFCLGFRLVPCAIALWPAVPNLSLFSDLVLSCSDRGHQNAE